MYPLVRSSVPFFSHVLTPIAAALLAWPALANANPATGPAPAASPPEGLRVQITGASAASAGTPELGQAGSLGSSALAGKRAATSDTAALLADLPGVSVQGAGGVSALPVVHGLADDRLRVLVDGVDALASCPNHMNPPLSYINPTSVGEIQVFAGIVPVSVGGDSIGGAVVVKSPDPVFAETGNTLVSGELGAFYRSNGRARGANMAATYATDSLSLTYRGSLAKADDYKAGAEFKRFDATGNGSGTLPRDVVGSSAYKTENQSLDLAYTLDNHLLVASYSHQNIPYQWYPNQRMDMLGNEQDRLNVRYKGRMAWGVLEAQAYHEEVEHGMNFGADKQFQYGTAPGMPMLARSRTSGANLKASIDLADSSVLRLGSEYQQYRLNDWWPPSGTGGMSPYNFLNLNNGQRKRLGLYAEWEKQLTPQWMAQVGARYERVTSSAGAVHGYNLNTFPTVLPGGAAGMTGMASQTPDAAGFNNANRSQTDHNFNLTALARYSLNDSSTLEFGYAHKERSPNLYERYAWSSWPMAAVMNNTVGDGNGYFGNPKLKPEKADTLSATLHWKAPDNAAEFRFTPYYTHVTDYVDAVRWSGNAGSGAPATTPATQPFNVLRYVNQRARLYGADLSARMHLADNGWGKWGVKGSLAYVRGKNLDTGSGLYNVMPLTARLALDQRQGGWHNTVEWESVAAKRHTSQPRNEIKTPGYGLLHLRSSYTWKNLRLDVGLENVFNKMYYLPLGGTYVGQGRTMGINTIPGGIGVPGPGRSVYAGMHYKF